ncbi:MAG: alpha-L-arabinofuranosidase A, partial [Sediminibacterium sp.]
VHQDATMLPLTLKSNDYKMGKEILKAVSASASKDKNGLTHVSLVNIDASKEQEVTINVSGANYTGVTGRILTSDKLQNYNSFENPGKVKPVSFSGANLSGSTLKVKLPPFSVVVLELK